MQFENGTCNLSSILHLLNPLHEPIKSLPDSARQPHEFRGSLKLFQHYVIPNYGRFPVALVRGEDS